MIAFYCTILHSNSVSSPPPSFKHFPSLQLSFAIISFSCSSSAEEKKKKKRKIVDDNFKRIFEKRIRFESNRDLTEEKFIFIFERVKKDGGGKNRIYIYSLELLISNLLKRMKKN